MKELVNFRPTPRLDPGPKLLQMGRVFNPSQATPISCYPQYYLGLSHSHTFQLQGMLSMSFGASKEPFSNQHK